MLWERGHSDIMWSQALRVRTIWKVGVVAAGYVITQLGSQAILEILGLMAETGVEGDPIGTLVGIALAGLVIGAMVGPLAWQIPVARWWHVVVWSVLLFLNMTGILLEGTFFAPDLAPIENLPGGLLSQLTVAVVTAGLVAWLFVPATAEGDISLRERPWLSWSIRVLAGALVYLVFFFVVGGLNYEFVTKPYYEAQYGGLTTPPVEVVFSLETLRGVLIALSVVPFVRAFPGPKRRRALFAGGLLFLFSGVVPLLFQIATLPAFLLFASGYEILLQVGPTGVVVAYLLGPHGGGAGFPQSADASNSPG